MSIEVEPIVILPPFEMEHEAVDLVHNTKGSAWNRVGDNKLIGTDQWRYNYNPDTGIFEGRTIMGQWTIEILDPRDMTTGNWQGSATVTRDQVGIDGDANTACLVDANGSADDRRQSIPVSANTNTHIAVVHIKKDNDESRFPALQLNVGGTSNSVQINTKTGAIQTRLNATSSDANVEDKGNWWELSIKNSGDGSDTTALMILWPSQGSTFGDFDSGASGSAVFDAAQVFLNHSSPPPTPVYGETAGQSHTQDPDIATVTDLDAINYNPDESTFSIEFNSAYSEGTLFDLHTDANNRIYAHRNASNEIHLVIVDGGTTQADLNLGTISDNTNGKIAVGWKENDIAGSLNGGTVQTDTTATIPTVDTLHIGRDYNDANFWNVFIGEMKNFPRKLTNAQHQQETTS